MSASRKLKEAIQQLAGTHLKDEVFMVDCNVDSVDMAKGLCTATTIGENAQVQLPEINLESTIADGLLIIPAVDSIITVMYSKRGDAYIIKYSDIDNIYFTGKKWQFGDGTFGGLIKIDNLKLQYDANVAAIKASIDAALAVIDTQLMALSQPGGSVASFNSAATAIKNLVKATLENTDVTHGA